MSSSEPKQSIARAPRLNIGDLPQELLNQIFGKLGPHDLQAAALTSQGMNRSVKEAAHFNEFHSLKKFIRTLIQKLPEQKERLAKIAQNIVFQDFANLQKLKEYILDVKAQLMGVIKTVDEETVKGLHHDIRPPHFLENIFTLAALERQIEEAYLIPDENDRGNAFWEISTALAQAGDIERALAVAELISGEEKRAEALRYISKAVAQAGNIDRSLSLAESIPFHYLREFALRDISEALAQAGNIDRALEVAGSMSGEFTRGGALRDISKALAQAGDIERALAVVKLIPDDWARGEELSDISKALAQAGNRDKAIAVAKLIPNDNMMIRALYNCM